MRSTLSIRKKILFYWKEKKSYKKIRDLLLLHDRFKISVTSIYKIVKKFKTDEQVSDRRRSGRIPILRPRHLAYLDELIRNNI